MKRSNKKGFTIVELVIVIAVIAILAAVLIPTFINLTKKANESVDMQLVRHMNTALQTDEALNEKASDVIKAKAVLESNGITQFKPVDSECVFYWISTDNRVVLYNSTDSKVIYPEDYTEKQKAQTWYDLNADDVESNLIQPKDGQSIAEALIEAVQNAGTTKHFYFTLPANSEINMSSTQFPQFMNALSKDGQGKKIHLDLNGSSIIYRNVSEQTSVPNNAVLELFNGGFDYKGKGAIDTSCPFAVKDGASLIFNEMKVSAEDAKAIFFPSATASELIISNSEIQADSTFLVSTNGASSNKIRIQIENSTLEGTGICVLINVPSYTTVENSTLIGCTHALAVRTGNVNVKNSTLKTTETNADIFTYKNFAYGTMYAGGYWSQGNIFPAAVIVAGDYSKNDKGISYQGDVKIDLENVDLVSANADEVPTVLMASNDSTKTVSVCCDDTSVVGDIQLYGANWNGTGSNAGVTIANKGNITVNGKAATLESGKTKIGD